MPIATSGFENTCSKTFIVEFLLTFQGPKSKRKKYLRLEKIINFFMYDAGRMCTFEIETMIVSENAELLSLT